MPTTIEGKRKKRKKKVDVLQVSWECQEELFRADVRMQTTLIYSVQLLPDLHQGEA
jgi:hypothetical protein